MYNLGADISTMPPQAGERPRSSSNSRAEVLVRKVNAGFRRMQPFRDARKKVIDEYLSNYYGSNEPTKRPWNLVRQMIRTYTPKIVQHNPKVLVTPKRSMLKWDALMLEMAMEHLNEETEFCRVMRELVVDAFMLMGIAYTTLEASGAGKIIDEKFIPSGSITTRRISFDQFVVSPAATVIWDSEFYGHRCLYTKEGMLDAGYDPETIEMLPRANDEMHRSASYASRGGISNHQMDPDYERVYVTELYFPHENMVRTISGHRDQEAPPILLREHEYEGPDTGPYDFLGYDWPPDNIFPVSPALANLDLHLAANDLGKRILHQIQAMKNIVVGPKEIEDDLDEVKNATDLAVLALGNPDLIKSLAVGGPSSAALQIHDWLQRQSAALSGNTDLLGGIRSQAKTATEAEQLFSSANTSLEDMREQVQQFVTGIQKKRAWFLHHDPYIELPMTRRLPEGIEIPVRYSADSRRGAFLDFNFAIEPYSMATEPPEMRFQKLQQFTTNFLLGAVQVWMATGGALDLNELVREGGRLIGVDTERWWNADQLHQMVQMMAQQTYQPDGTPAAKLRSPGLPGTQGAPGANNAGARSPGFDIQQNTASMMGG